MAESEAMSKSAKKRAAKKARDAAGEESAPPAPAAPTPAPKAKSEPKAKAEPKAKSEPKAKAAASAPAAEPKAKAKAKADPVPKAAAEPKAPKAEVASAPAAKSKSAGKAKAKKAPAKKDEEVQEVVEQKKGNKMEDLVPVQKLTQKEWQELEGAGDWEVSTGLGKKMQKQKEAKERKEKALADEKKSQGLSQEVSTKTLQQNQKVVGADFVETKTKAKAGAPVVSQAVTASAMAAAKEEAAAPVADNTYSTTVQVPEAKIGIVIGPKGKTIALIKEKSGCTRIDADGNSFTLSGKRDEVLIAEAAIQEIAQKGYCSLCYEDFAENFINVPVGSLPDIIGKQGKIIRTIKEELGTEVSIPPNTAGSDPAKKVRVTIAGKAEGVEKTKGVISDILMYYHSEVTHPGEVHDELDVQEWQRGFIIGKGGSEMRHIQNNFKVRMYIPRDNSLNKNVVVVGEPYGVERAKKYIDRLINEAGEAVKGRDRNDKAEDHFGDEEPIEEWMRPYMYRRN